MIRVLVTGAAGQVATELLRCRWPENMEVHGRRRQELDVTDAGAVADAVKGFDLVINTAAYTAVDEAETDTDRACLVNARAPGIIAEACANKRVPMIYLSTDYVFDGSKAAPWVEEDPVAPISAYGASKAAGERSVRAAHSQHVILRTSWVYAEHGHNFVKTMVRLGRERSHLRVVDDQFGAPTAARDIAAAIVVIARRMGNGDGQLFGTYHYAAQGRTTWYGFAQAIFDCAERRWGRRPTIEPIRTIDYPTPAKRPRNSILACDKIMATFNPPRRPWRVALKEVMMELLDDEIQQVRV